MEILKSEAMFLDGIIQGENIESYQKNFDEVKYLYKNPKIKGNPVVYEVYSFTKGNQTNIGNLIWGLTVLKPILINGECNMTKGHFHKNRDCAEFYFGIEGKGLLLLMNEFGECWAENVFAGSIHHINGKLAHRLVNTGDKDFKVGACWSPMAGHDYRVIEEHPFPYRILKEENEIKIIKI